MYPISALQTGIDRKGQGFFLNSFAEFDHLVFMNEIIDDLFINNLESFQESSYYKSVIRKHFIND